MLDLLFFYANLTKGIFIMLKLKPVIAATILLAMSFSVCSCKKADITQPSITGPFLSMYDYSAIEDGETVALEGYVQDKELLWNKTENESSCSFYIQTDVGAAYVYDAKISPETYDAMTEGILVRVQGTKTTWSGLPEITNALVEVVGGSPYSAPYLEIKSDEIPSSYLNARVTATGKVTKLDSGNIIEYGFNNQGGRGDNISFLVTVSDGDKAVSVPCEVDTHLVASASAVYASAESLTAGNAITVNGVLSARGNNYFIRVTDISVS